MSRLPCTHFAAALNMASMAARIASGSRSHATMPALIASGSRSQACFMTARSHVILTSVVEHQRSNRQGRNPQNLGVVCFGRIGIQIVDLDIAGSNPVIHPENVAA